MLLAVDKAELAERVVNVSLALGIGAFLIGVVLLLIDWVTDRQVRRAAKKASQQLITGVPEHGIKIPDLGSALGSLAEVAKALKSLDRSTRLLVVSLVLLAIAAVGAFISG
jgi:hypothetical protein